TLVKTSAKAASCLLYPVVFRLATLLAMMSMRFCNACIDTAELIMEAFIVSPLLHPSDFIYGFVQRLVIHLDDALVRLVRPERHHHLGHRLNRIDGRSFQMSLQHLDLVRI